MLRTLHWTFSAPVSKSKAEVSNILPIIKDSNKSPQAKRKHHQLRNS